jgi:predicted component of type VI protein secretion system
MKRCPQCEFIYEDDQSLCDMDGVLLVFDSRTLPNLHALETVPAVPGKAVRRNRMVPAFATILLTLVIASFYYFSTPRSVAPPPVENFAPASVPAAVPAASSAETPAPPPAPTPEPEKQPTAPAPKPAAPVAAPPAKKATTTKPAAVKSVEPKKDDSKVGSILKKTGRILKKPFRF